MILFFKVFLTEFIAEMGDKTQLMLIALTSKYKLRDIILGTAAAILVLNGLAVLAGGLVSEFIPAWLIKVIAALAFLYFAASTLAGDDDEEEEGNGRSRIRFAPFAVFCTFFVAELGDKTQLTAITFGANEGMSSALIVWLGCSLGLLRLSSCAAEAVFSALSACYLVCSHHRYKSVPVASRKMKILLQYRNLYIR